MTKVHPALPILSAGAGIATFSVMDALMKGASLAVGVYSALWWRCILGAVFSLGMWWVAEKRLVWPDAATLRIHAFRACLTCGMASLFFWGLVRTPMAVGIALSFISPLIALYLSALFLGEPVTRRALVASGVALSGVAVIAAGRLGESQAHGADSRMGIVAILASAVLYAGNLVVQRHQAQRAAPTEIAFFQSFCMVALMAPLAPWLAGWPLHGGFGLDAMGWVAGAAFLSSVSVILLSWGWARAQAHQLLPMEYSAFIWSAVVGWWWFGERLTGWTLGGVALIVLGVWVGTAAGHDGAGLVGAESGEGVGEMGGPGA